LSVCLIFSKFNVTIIPNNEPIKLPATPIKDPIIINILKIEKSDVPIVLRIAISFDLFLTKIKRHVITLNAATIIINDRIINITFLSIDRVSKKKALTCFQSLE
jgi:hypothetical protein